MKAPARLLSHDVHAFAAGRARKVSANPASASRPRGRRRASAASALRRAASRREHLGPICGATASRPGRPRRPRRESAPARRARDGPRAAQRVVGCQEGDGYAGRRLSPGPRPPHHLVARGGTKRPKVQAARATTGLSNRQLVDAFSQRHHTPRALAAETRAGAAGRAASSGIAPRASSTSRKFRPAASTSISTSPGPGRRRSVARRVRASSVPGCLISNRNGRSPAGARADADADSVVERESRATTAPASAQRHLMLAIRRLQHPQQHLRLVGCVSASRSTSVQSSSGCS